MKIDLKNGYYLAEDENEGISQVVLHRVRKQEKDGKTVDRHISFYGSWTGALIQTLDDPRLMHDVKTKKDLMEWLHILEEGKKSLSK